MQNYISSNYANIIQHFRVLCDKCIEAVGLRAIQIFLLIFWSAPLWTGFFGRLLKRAALFQDYEEIACAAERRLQHLTLYGDTKCPGVHSAPFVYPPWVADAFAAPLSWLGRDGLLIVYAAIFVAALATLLWFALWRPLSEARFSFRVAFLGMVAGGPIAFGNISVLVHAGVYVAALAAGADSLVFALTVSLVSLIKPLYLLFFTFTAFSPASLRRKAMIIALGAAAPLATLFVTSPDVVLWRETVASMMSGSDRGGGFVNWMYTIGVRTVAGEACLYALYGAALFFAGYILSEFGQLTNAQRVWLGGAVTVLLFPRIMSYDVLALGPGIIAALAAKTSTPRPIFSRFGWLAMLSCGVCFTSTIFGGAIHGWREFSYLGLVAVIVLSAAEVAKGPSFKQILRPHTA